MNKTTYQMIASPADVPGGEGTLRFLRKGTCKNNFPKFARDQWSKDREVIYAWPQKEQEGHEKASQGHFTSREWLEFTCLLYGSLAQEYSKEPTAPKPNACDCE